jgi:hypothetical protein
LPQNFKRPSFSIDNKLRGAVGTGPGLTPKTCHSSILPGILNPVADYVIIGSGKTIFKSGESVFYDHPVHAFTLKTVQPIQLSLSSGPGLLDCAFLLTRRE